MNRLLHCAASDWKGLPSWMSESHEAGKLYCGNQHIIVNTLEGQLRGDFDDWLIRGIAGEIYPCKPHIFEATYEEAE